MNEAKVEFQSRGLPKRRAEGPGDGSRSDEQLVSAIARGDQSAFAQLYDRYSARMFGFARKMVRQPTAAEDVVQEVFLQVWRKAGAYDPQLSKPVVWLMLIARARAVDWLRRHGNDRSTPADWIRLNSNGSLSFHSQVDADDDAQLSREALAQLPPEQFDALSLAFHGGMTCQQIATLRALPLGTVKTRIRLGMNRLRDLMNHQREGSR
ncbi:MAG: sigma-70 family RNA polymerase sigma factor [Phycisphaerales bacterium]|nr:sigma-70 family RNA polymerase sigma factor [Phycisphaerales bacterium]MCI0632007.1 sigma-70 family RNA polymerase sigma factor [Phycisphaerales bacterium]MCI0677126.1 sigma-70 family RNA polymerase sigma factor [Phycisphaerales bacterium]